MMMKRQRFSDFAVFVVLALFVCCCTGSWGLAQGGDAKLTPAPTPKPTPAPKSAPKPAPRPAAPPVPVTPKLIFSQEVKERLDLKSLGKIPGGALFAEFILNAKADDWLNFQLEGEDPDLAVQILDADKNQVPVARGGPNLFKINTQTGGVPADGEYRLRVTGKQAAPFSLTVNRQGLTVNVFNERFNRTYASIRETDPASIDAAIAEFEALARDDGYRPMTFEQLGLMYLYNRKDFDKAAAAMEQAITLNGAAVVKITFDAQWRRMARQRSGKTDWDDARTGWLRIRPGQLILTDPGNRPLVTISGAQIAEMSSITSASYHLVSITGMQRRQFLFAPGSREKAEADLVVKLIQNHVLRKTN
jgi:tetratricopeptide (TPR) repeat protein